MIYAPVDLTMLRRRVEAGLAPLTAAAPVGSSSGSGAGVATADSAFAAQQVVACIAKQLLRDLLLMFANARMYNNREHSVHRIAGEMCSDVLAEVCWCLFPAPFYCIFIISNRAIPVGIIRHNSLESGL